MAKPFTPEQISQILEEFFKVVGTRQYIGARYVPIFGRKGEESIEWDNSAPYEPLTIVLYQGNSYTSRQYVPVGVEITNQEFWAITGNYNAQVESYRREVREILPLDKTPTEGSTKGATSDGISKAISSETTRATEAEQANATAISSETTRATNAEKANADAITANNTAIALNTAMLAGTADSGLKTLIETKFSKINFVTPEQYGAKGDGITNDYEAIVNAINSGHPVIFSNKTYGIDRQINISIDNLSLIGNSTTIKLLTQGTTTEVTQGTTTEVREISYFFQVSNSQNIYICNITFNANANWMQRVPETSNLFDEYIKRRRGSYPALKILDCKNVTIDNCISCYSCAGFYIKNAENINISNSISKYTLADGVFVADGTNNMHVNNHTCIYVDDDCYTADGYTNDISTNPHDIYYDNCSAFNAYTRFFNFEGANNCHISNSYGYIVGGYSPFTLGTLKGYSDNFGNNYFAENITIWFNPKNGVWPSYLVHGNMTNTSPDVDHFTIDNVVLKNVRVYTEDYDYSYKNSIFYANVTLIDCYLPNLNAHYGNFNVKNCKFYGKALNVSNSSATIKDTDFNSNTDCLIQDCSNIEISDTTFNKALNIVNVTNAHVTKITNTEYVQFNCPNAESIIITDSIAEHFSSRNTSMTALRLINTGAMNTAISAKPVNIITDSTLSVENNNVSITGYPIINAINGALPRNCSENTIGIDSQNIYRYISGKWQPLA